jgi:hypothetical protein
MRPKTTLHCIFLNLASFTSGISCPRTWPCTCAQVIKAHRSLDKKPLHQILPVLSRPLLLSLGDDGVQLHTLPDMMLKFQVCDCVSALVCMGAWVHGCASCVHLQPLFICSHTFCLLSKATAEATE